TDGDNASKTCQLWVVRHAESLYNEVGRTQGWLDIPLSAAGRDQAQQAGDLLRQRLISTSGAPLAGIVASDLKRAAETARIIAVELDWDPSRIRLDPGLREYHIGAWSGLTEAEIEARWPGQLALWRTRRLDAPPDGETRGSFARRIRDAL